MRLLFYLFLFYCPIILAQNEYHFAKLSVEDGLSDTHVQVIGQDKYGYMWLGTLSGISRYDGRNMTQFIHRAEDTTTILSEMSLCMTSDSAGRFFIGFANGLAEFDFKTRRFHRIQAAKGKNISCLIPLRKDLIFMMTTQGLATFNPMNSTVHFLQNDSLLTGEISSGYYKNGKLYLVGDKGLIIYDVTTQKTQKIALPVLENAIPRSVVLDNEDNIWVTAHGKNRISRTSADFTKTEVYDRYLMDNEPSALTTFHLVKDLKGRIWITSKSNGLLQYLPETNSFIRHLHDPQKRWSPSSSSFISVYCNREGIIWAGGAGINFFSPDKNLFSSLLPFDKDVDKRQRHYARCVVEDKDHNLWLGTRDGLVQYDTKTKTRKEWRNEGSATNVLCSNIVFDLYCDAENNIWIATMQGLNRYNRKVGKIEVLSGKNDFPKGTYKSFMCDKEGNLWLSLLSNDGLYTYNFKEQKLHTIREHPQLKQFVGMPIWITFQDSKGRFWFAFDEQGLGMYDPNTQQTGFWQADANTDGVSRDNREGGIRIAGNVIIDIKEDKKGIIWVSSFSGLTSIDYDKKVSKIYRHETLQSASLALTVDSLNRLWVSTGRGLVLLDSSRTSFTPFGTNDGLPSVEFTENNSYICSNGTVILPSRQGFVTFNPLNYAAEKRLLDFYVASFSAGNIERPLIEDDGTSAISIDLDADENAFQFQLVALNYLNKNQTWFAYYLEGLDKDWHYTQDLKAVYTNVPGGNYIFHYKATTNQNNWQVSEKTIAVHIATVFYKTWWFWGLILGGILFGIYKFYRYREVQQQQVYDLSSKAQLLEKEKAVMQYEGLKQQLNPHFLFNSLTSLSSLIQIDPSVAATFLDNLSKTYRYILKSSEAETVPLRDEIKFAQNFVDLQKVRFEQGLEVEFKVDEEDLDKRIVPVTLQNMIENAIKHNIIDDETPLKIAIFTEGGYLLIENNLQKKRFVETSNKRGLANLTSLYHYMSDLPLTTVETDHSFIVKIPLI